MSLVSVVIPTYNRSWGLRRAVASVLAQSFTDLELIIADDASSDDTEDVARYFDDPRIRYFRQPSNVGVSRNWGAGVAMARGTYLCLLMDDDSYQPNFVLDRVTAFTNFPEAHVAFAGYVRIDPDGGKTGEHRPALPTNTLLRHSDFLHAALARAVFVGAAMYRTSTLKALWPTLLPSGCVIDFTLNIRLALSEEASALFLDQTDFTLAEHLGQLSVTEADTVFALGVAVLEELLAEPLPEWARPLIVQELSNWNLVGGRRSANQGDRLTAVRRLLSSARLRPLSTAPWKQLARVVLGIRDAAAGS